METTVDEIIGLVSAWRGKAISVEALPGGMTNSSFKVSVDESLYFVSIPGHGAHLLGMDRRNRAHNATLSGEAGLSPKVIQRLPSDRALVTEFLPIPHCSPESLQRADVQQRLLRTLKALHSGSRFWRNFDMFGLIASFTQTINDRKYALPAGYPDLRPRIQETGIALSAYRENLVPCHNDLVPENVMDDGIRSYLLDFDYSGNNDPCFDLSSISVEAGYDCSQVRELARAYFGLVSEEIIARIHLHGILGDVGWSLWSVIQAQIAHNDFAYGEYGLHRWRRAYERVNSRDFGRWIEAANGPGSRIATPDTPQ